MIQLLPELLGPKPLKLMLRTNNAYTFYIGGADVRERNARNRYRPN